MTRYLMDQCCGCIELKTGCLIIGYINLIEAIMGFVMAVMLARSSGSLTDDDLKVLLNNRPHDQQAIADVTTAVTITAVILSIVMIFLFALTVVFLVGVYQDRRAYVKAFMVFLVIFLVISIVSFFASFANTRINAGEVSTTLLNIITNAYFYLIVRSYYYRMHDVSRQPAIYNTC